MKGVILITEASFANSDDRIRIRLRRRLTRCYRESDSCRLIQLKQTQGDIRLHCDQFNA